METRPHILHLSSALTWRGGEQQIAYLMEQLDLAGCKQSLYAPDGSALATILSARFHTITYRKRGGTDVIAALELARIAKQGYYDLLHCHDAHAHTTAILAVSLFRMRLPIVLYRRVIFEPGSSWLSRYKYRHPAIRRVVCVSDAVADVMRDYTHRADIVRVVPSGIDTEQFDQAPRLDIRERMGWPAETKVIMGLAALTEEKGIPEFIAACRQLLMRYPEVRAVVFGEGDRRASLEQHIARYNMQSHIRLPGFDAQAKLYLRSADVLLSPSHSEGLGTTIMEAFISGTPVVACPVGGVQELILPERTGLTAPVGDPAALAQQVARLLTDRELRTRLTALARRHVAHYDYRHLGTRMLAVYHEVLT